MESKKKDILERSRRLAVSILKFSNGLPRTTAGYVIAQQFIKSGTSVGANTIEAQDASSRKDFINKMSISLRECRETKYWITIIKDSGLSSSQGLDELTNEIDELCAIYSSIVKNARNK